MPKSLKFDENWWKLANIEREFLHIFWTIWGNSMKFSGDMSQDNIKSHKKPSL